jgi:nitric oxide reductase activation protein
MAFWKKWKEEVWFGPKEEEDENVQQPRNEPPKKRKKKKKAQKIEQEDHEDETLKSSKKNFKFISSPSTRILKIQNFCDKFNRQNRRGRNSCCWIIGCA